jgi:uridine kinase
MAERGWTLAQVQESIEARKPDFAAYVAPQMEFSDVVISVLPSDISTEAVGKHLKVPITQSAIFIASCVPNTDIELHGSHKLVLAKV